MSRQAPGPEPEVPSTADLLFRCLDAAPAARRRVLEQLAREHPQHAAELKRLHGLLSEFGLLESEGSRPILS